MSDPKGKALPDLISMYLVMLVIYCLDVFFLKSDLTVLGDNFYSRFLCLTVLLMTVVFKKEHLKSFGISSKKEKVKSALIFGTFFSAVPILVMSVIEYVIFKISEPGNLAVKFTPPSLSYVQTAGYLTPVTCIIIYILTSILAACFKEMFFRGFLLHKLEKLTTFKAANAFQALLYTTFIIPKLVRNFTMSYYGDEIVSIAAYVIIFYLIHEFLTGLKWGMLAKKAGSTYISIVDNFLYVFLANSLHIVEHQSKWLFMIHMLSAQLISFAMVAVYCKKSTSVKEKSTEKAEVKSDNKAPIETTLEKKSEKGKSADVNNETQQIERDEIKSEVFDGRDEISPSAFKEIVRKNAEKGEKPHNGDLSEQEIDNFLKTFGKPKAQYKPPMPKGTKSSKPEKFDVDDFLKDFSNN